MAKREMYEQLTEQLLQPITEAHGYEIVDVEYVKEGGTMYLRAYIDKPGGIGVDDCEIVSRSLSDLLDEKDFIDEPYVLEVSSPGLGRPLKKEKDYIRSKGQEVEIHLFRAVSGSKSYEGILKDWDEKTVTIEDAGRELCFEKVNISLIRLAFDF